MADGSRSDPRERDYGDAAGYGTGGSTSDYRDVVGDEDANRPPGPNPLDAIMSAPGSSRQTNQWGRVNRPDIGLALMAASAAVTVSLGVLLWRRIRSDRKQHHAYADREMRQRAARFQF
jgi:hypothetical protein